MPFQVIALLLTLTCVGDGSTCLDQQLLCRQSLQVFERVRRLRACDYIHRLQTVGGRAYDGAEPPGVTFREVEL